MSQQTESDLEAAMLAHLTDEGHMDDADAGLGDWMIVVHIPSLDPGSDGSYSNLMSRGHLPGHIARGLLAVGMERVMESEDPDERS